MEKDYYLEYQCLLSGIYIEAIKQLLLDKKIITEKEWSDKVKYILSEPNLKDIYDRIEYFMHLQKISEKARRKIHLVNKQEGLVLSTAGQSVSQIGRQIAFYCFNDIADLVFRQAGVHRKAQNVLRQILRVVEGVFRIRVEILSFPRDSLEGGLIAKR